MCARIASINLFQVDLVNQGITYDTVMWKAPVPRCPTPLSKGRGGSARLMHSRSGVLGKDIETAVGQGGQ